eukprot:gnl/TRDRNA2_/TRDRNA2_197554_c0_seq1.p1 gnl/TRDRNA2_/TRDRNA2_197554_c0~~gnl/TRDRNA2_/TRDRNA2_197554_c0_seq1.p1  ORF type:complete len:248 (-),score=67.75 gnl/TRDRNA2_/TRDRNA2_197554_c0_seq1:103-846(-)
MNKAFASAPATADAKSRDADQAAAGNFQTAPAAGGDAKDTKPAAFKSVVGSDNPERAGLARELNQELQVAAKQHKQAEDKASQLWPEFDKEKKGLSHTDVEAFLKRLNDDKRPTNADVQFFWRSVKKPASGEAVMKKEEFMNSLRAWETYKKYRRDIDILFYLYDMNGNGQLDGSEVRFLLEEMRGSKVADKEFESVLKSANVVSMDNVSRMEVVVIIASWHASTEHEQFHKAAAKEKEGGSGCTLQ